ncbi:MAG: hypothetical protein PHI70_10320 [Proteiniphilum sp.]|nr:hypothetical protein [Candidatus Cloacimonadota bacterium]MDD2248077.1 hypothetical protein [Proteiniphilum sp.]MDD4417163.1 hypothetical protein [Proteiniphilum sp.]
MKQVLLICCMLLFILSACSVHKMNQNAVAEDNFGYVLLLGNLDGRRVLINEKSVIIDEGNRFGLRSGTYNLEIRSDDRIVVKRVVYITAGQTVEVKVP